MAVYRSDTLIKSLRMQSGLTQTQLAEGIVTKETISRIERGLHVPTTFVMEKLLERLGVDPRKYISAVISPEDFYLDKIKLEFEILYQSKKFAEARKYADEIEKTCGDNAFHKQYICSIRANLAFSDEHDFDKVLEYTNQGLRLTLPDFTQNNIKHCVFSTQEASLINMMAAAHYMREEYDTAITILKDLIASLERGYLEAREQSRTYVYVVNNLTQFLIYAKRFEECYEMSKQGILHSKKLKETLALPNLYCKLASAAFKLGKIDEAKKAVDLARHLYIGLERDRELEELNNALLKEVGFDY